MAQATLLTDDLVGNWAYLFHGDVMEPDDIADADTDGMSGPIATDRIDIDTMTGEHRYHFGYMEPGKYRVASYVLGVDGGDAWTDASIRFESLRGCQGQWPM